MPLYYGSPVILVPSLVDTTWERIPRSWRERWFSWPWRPWVAETVVAHHKPTPYVYRSDDGKYYMHPEIWDRIRGRLDDAYLAVFRSTPEER